MKKFTLMALALMASAASFAQTTSWNFENDEIGADGGFWTGTDRCPHEVVDNPLKEGVNTSAKCLKFTISGNEWNNGAIATSLNGTGLNTKKRMLLTVKKGVASNVRVDINCGDGVYKKVVAYYSDVNNWQQLGFDFSTNGEFNDPIDITIYATTDAVEASQDVYIDDIMIVDQPTVNGAQLSTLGDNSISGNVKLTGAWMKGTCMNADGEWSEVNYNDFEAFNAKAAATLTSVDMCGTVTKDADINQFFFKNPNTLLYADAAYDRANVIAPNADGALRANEIELADGNDFNAPYPFTASKVKMTRTLRKGVNSFVLPFYTSPSDLGASRIATFDSATDYTVNFTTTDHADGNVPFIAEFDNTPEDNVITFNGSEKNFEPTPSEFAGNFRGVYAKQSATGLYGINADGHFQKGSDTATISAFKAYYTTEGELDAAAAVTIDGEATAINTVNATTTAADGAVYDLSGRRVAASLAAAKLVKGVYVVNGKKFIVK